MWQCEDVTERASDRLDGHLRVLDRMTLLAHLSVCRNCRRYLRQFDRTVALLRRLPAEAADEPPAAATLHRLRGRPQP